ncbi:MAG TPA: TIR domain-containing protein [Steroidobacteraceae bacterium]|jgi:adenylate cyclase|nr:TIR domain-containing protein [Steroidobacteraceae bacterium]
MSEPDSGATREAFVSYAAADRPAADALTAYLEQRGIRCWIAPRDVPAGALYADAIVRAINEAPVLLLLLSRNSIGSSHVGKELERASSKRKQIVAVRLDDAPLTPAFEYFLSESQWVDVAADGRETAFARLAAVFALPAPAGAAAVAPLAALSTPASGTRPASRSSARPTRPWMLWVPAVLGLAALIGGAALYFTRSQHAAAPAAPAALAKSIAVLPFTDMSQAHDQEFFADGMAEQILDLLAKIPSLKVIARTSSFQFKGKSEDARVVGEKLGVATLLEGSIRKSAERLRITAQLIRTSDGSHLWSEVYDREVRDVFRTQDEIADAVVGALKVSLLGAPEQRAVPTANTGAYTLYLQALASARGFSRADQDAALAQLHKALALDPNFAPAWALLADVESATMVFGTTEPFEKVGERMTEAAQRALALDPKLAGPHVTLSNTFFFTYDYVASQRELARGLELEPQNPDALSLSAYLAIAACQLDDAERSARALIERDPLSVDPYRALGTALWFHGRLGESEAVYRRAIALSPGAESMRWRLTLVLLSAGRPQDALQVADAEPAPGWRSFARVVALDALGRRAEADPILAEAEADPVIRVSGQYQLAQIYAHRGDREHAFGQLERARQARDPGFVSYIKCDPMLAPLRNDPRYKAMLAQLNLPP